MDRNQQTKELKFYLSNTDKIRLTTVYSSLIYAAKRYGLSGATVYKGIMGYGASSRIVTSSFWEFTEKVPVVIEFVDSEEKITGFIEKMRPWLQMLPKGCLVTCHNVDVVFSKCGDKAK
jgi:PII-like signaling protein